VKYKFFCLFLLIQPLSKRNMAQQTWKMQPSPVMTKWAETVNPDNALKEYPRPQLVRDQWENLNGLWDYAITPKNALAPIEYDGKILVPFPVESSLSGVKKSLKPNQNLWYHRVFTAHPVKGRRLLLHFGAVDNEATVFVNDKEVVKHTGGFTAFTADISDAIKEGDNEIKVKVWDPTDEGIYPHGKQVLKPQNIYYTASSGIWQTVWLEAVPDSYISSLILTPDIDKKILEATVKAPIGLDIELTVFDRGTKVVSRRGKSGSLIQLPIANMHLWSPEDPFLYDISISLKKGNQVIDAVASYFGMRKISIQKDSKGVDRIFLNNSYTYNLGTLDQGFWPDGLLTAPTDDALAFDIEAIKAMGFNTIRKHIKIEPARWYYHADKIGIMVWQDMVNPNQSLPAGAKEAFEKQSTETLEQLHNYPCITTWVLFNERWGAYDQARLTQWVKDTDPSRLVNGHSGELLYVNDQLRFPSDSPYVNSDMTDVHSYPDPRNAIMLPGKARVLGEYGGIGVFIADHQWSPASGWGYIQVTPSALQGKYAIMTQHLRMLEKEGLSGSIYTQPFDVEGEENGLITYDRKIVKIPFESMRRINAALAPKIGMIPEVALTEADLTDPALSYSRLLEQFVDGKTDAPFLAQLTAAASRAGDKNGASRIAGEYINTLTEPYNKEQLEFVLQNTNTIQSKAFNILQKEASNPQSPLDQRTVSVKLMNTIFAELMEPALRDPNTAVNWDSLQTKIIGFGAPGEEIFLRAKTVYYFNRQEWDKYGPVALIYLEKYGKNMPEKERDMFRNAITNNKAKKG